MEWRRDGYVISTEPARLDRDVIWQFLRTAYWSLGVELHTVDRAIDNSLAFGLYGRFGFQPVDDGRMMERPAGVRP